LNSTPTDEHKFLELVNENRNKILKVCRVYEWNPSEQEICIRKSCSNLAGVARTEGQRLWEHVALSDRDQYLD